MKRLLLACAAVALVAPGATADTGSCLLVPDAPETAPAAAVLLAMQDALPAGDVVSLGLEATTGAVTAVFTLAGPPDMAPGQNFEYMLSFSDADHDYLLTAEVTGAGLRVPISEPYEFNVKESSVGTGGTGSSSYERRPATGSVDLAARTVTISAPSSSFDAPLTAGHTFTTDGLRAYMGVGGSQIVDTDYVPTNDTLVVGTGC